MARDLLTLFGAVWILLGIVTAVFAIEVLPSPYCTTYEEFTGELTDMGYAQGGAIELPDASHQEMWANSSTGEFWGFVAENGNACAVFTGQIEGEES